jgi:CheY-like chemotaxis protein/MinD-like ATPase involved in chromosome partitioning or flagellar assembly
MAKKILIIDDDLDTLRLVGTMLQRQGYQIAVASSGEQGLVQAANESPDLVLVDVMMPEMDGYEVTRRLRSNPQTADIPILMFTAKTQLDDKVTGFESGADDYLTKPTHPAELQAHVKALLARSSRWKAGPKVAEAKPTFIIGVLAARGGHGVTTLAANLAKSLMTAALEGVIMAELRPGMGTLGLDLGEPDPKGLLSLLQAKPDELIQQKVKDSLFVHETGLRLLLGSNHPRDAMLLNGIAQFETIVNRLAGLAPYLVLDLGPGLTPLTQNLLKKCQHLIVVVEPTLNSVLHTKALLSDLVELDVNKRRISPVMVNRIRSDTQMNMTQVQEKLDWVVPAAIMPFPELVYRAVQMKTIAVSYQPDSQTTQQFAKLSALMLERARLEK